jgi:hypothetical protein
MMEIAFEDCVNFVRVEKRITPKHTEPDLEILMAARAIEDLFFTPRKLPKFKVELEAWTGLWAAKWSERIKIAKPQKTGNNFLIETKWSRLPQRFEILERLVPVTIRCGEFCGTTLIPTLAIKQQLSAPTTPSEAELLHSSALMIKILAKTRGPLIFITP